MVVLFISFSEKTSTWLIITDLYQKGGVRSLFAGKNMF